MNQLREEVHRFVDQLGPNHLFGIIQFTRKWDRFREELLPATEAVRADAREWINSSFRTTGTSGRGWTGGQPNGIEAVLQAAFTMDPQIDEIFIVSDADFQRTPPGGGGQDVPWSELRDLTKRLQQQSIGQARLRLLCFYPPEEGLADLRAWTRERWRDRLCPVRRRNGGTGSVRSANETEGPALSGPPTKRRDRLCPVRRRNGGTGSVRSAGGRTEGPALSGPLTTRRDRLCPVRFRTTRRDRLCPVRFRTTRRSSLQWYPLADDTEVVPPLVSADGRHGGRPSIGIRRRTTRRSSLHWYPLTDDTEVVPPRGSGERQFASARDIAFHLKSIRMDLDVFPVAGESGLVTGLVDGTYNEHVRQVD
jgi:hypothetical protein